MRKLLLLIFLLGSSFVGLTVESQVYVSEDAGYIYAIEDTQMSGVVWNPKVSLGVTFVTGYPEFSSWDGSDWLKQKDTKLDSIHQYTHFTSKGIKYEQTINEGLGEYHSAYVNYASLAFYTIEINAEDLKNPYLTNSNQEFLSLNKSWTSSDLIWGSKTIGNLFYLSRKTGTEKHPVRISYQASGNNDQCGMMYFYFDIVNPVGARKEFYDEIWFLDPVWSSNLVTNLIITQTEYQIDVGDTTYDEHGLFENGGWLNNYATPIVGSNAGWTPPDYFGWVLKVTDVINALEGTHAGVTMNYATLEIRVDNTNGSNPGSIDIDQYSLVNTGSLPSGGTWTTILDAFFTSGFSTGATDTIAFYNGGSGSALIDEFQDQIDGTDKQLMFRFNVDSNPGGTNHIQYSAVNDTDASFRWTLGWTSPVDQWELYDFTPTFDDTNPQYRSAGKSYPLSATLVSIASDQASIDSSVVRIFRTTVHAVSEEISFGSRVIDASTIILSVSTPNHVGEVVDHWDFSDTDYVVEGTRDYNFQYSTLASGGGGSSSPWSEDEKDGLIETGQNIQSIVSTANSTQAVEVWDTAVSSIDTDGTMGGVVVAATPLITSVSAGIELEFAGVETSVAAIPTTSFDPTISDTWIKFEDGLNYNFEQGVADAMKINGIMSSDYPANDATYAIKVNYFTTNEDSSSYVRYADQGIANSAVLNATSLIIQATTVVNDSGFKELIVHIPIATTLGEVSGNVSVIQMATVSGTFERRPHYAASFNVRAATIDDSQDTVLAEVRKVSGFTHFDRIFANSAVTANSAEPIGYGNINVPAGFPAWQWELKWDGSTWNVGPNTGWLSWTDGGKSSVLITSGTAIDANSTKQTYVTDGVQSSELADLILDATSMLIRSLNE